LQVRDARARLGRNRRSGRRLLAAAPHPAAGRRGAHVNSTGGWLAIGLVGQVLFSMRFLVQWITSERAGRSVLPVSFWHLSIAGSLVLLAYALHLRDVVFSLGQSAGVL